MNTITAEQYDVLRRNIDAYENTRQRLFPGVNGFSPCMVERIVREAGLTQAPTNQDRSKVELYEWVANPPDRYFAYIKENTRECTTWMGDVIGKVSFGSPYTNNMGDKRVPITVHGNNGKVYHGIYYKSAGDYCRLKVCKAKAKRKR